MKPHPLLIAAALLPLSACVSFGEKPPATLMTLTAATSLPAGPVAQAKDGQAVTVLPPTVPQALNVLRVPVQTGPTSIAYLKDAQWVEAPNRLFRNLLAETIGAKTGRPVLDLRQYSLAPGIRLTGRLQQFGLDAPSRQVVVVYDASLARGNGDVQTRRFEARVAVSAENAPTVAAALNSAANQVAGEVAEWIGA
ncbi:ABC-type transport auxiliary lipoprotein family protein [Sphingomonas sp. KC8]|uniref:ABC-type transport auxiliary lipoprotein family protein n=1 Tax=Sphingomonas sp. KC8 TaxID=1030157 RepID=UPI000248BE99|nr:ABC-type transport auxiliary lipoprotein family protein [Sphingomonas sp. KC8]